MSIVCTFITLLLIGFCLIDRYSALETIEPFMDSFLDYAANYRRFGFSYYIVLYIVSRFCYHGLFFLFKTY